MLGFLFITCSNQDSITGNHDDTVQMIPWARPQTTIPWPSLANTPWPMGKHDPQLTGRSPFAGPANGTVKWSFLDSSVWFSSGIILGKNNTLFYTSGEGGPQGSGFATCLNTAAGTVNWKFATNPLWNSITPLMLNNGMTIFGVNKNYSDRPPKVFALNQEGVKQWEYEIDSDMELVGFNVDLDGNIYFTTRDPPVLYSLDLDGNLQFKESLTGGKSYNGLAFSPDGNTLYLAEEKALLAYSTDGSLVWNFSLGNEKISSPPLVDNQGNIYFAAHDSDSGMVSIYSVSPEKEQRWRYRFESGSQYPVKDLTMDNNGYLYFNDLRHTVYSLYYNGGLRLRKELNTDQYPHVDSGVMCDADGNLYMGVSWSDYISLTSDLEIRWSIPMVEFGVNSWVFWNNPSALDNGILYGTTIKSPGVIFAIE
jgi:outer membrane protein assembly factor BamB